MLVSGEYNSSQDKIKALTHHTVPPAALPAVVPPCGVWLIRPQSSRLVALHPAPYGGQGGDATHGPQSKQIFDGGFEKVKKKPEKKMILGVARRTPSIQIQKNILYGRFTGYHVATRGSGTKSTFPRTESTRHRSGHAR